MSSIMWTRSVAVAGRVFLFSPRFNRIYLLEQERAANPVYTSLLGLREKNMKLTLSDPAAIVARTGRFEKPLRTAADEAPLCVGRFLPALYLFIHRFRFLASIARSAACIALLR